jgi:hypothetical protein
MEKATFRDQTDKGKKELVARTLNYPFTIRHFYAASILLLGMVIAMSCNKEKSVESNLSPLTIKLNLTANGTALHLNSLYTNDLGEDYSVTAFKFYLSNLSIADAQGGTAYEKESYHLVDASDSTTLVFQAPLSRISFDHLNFMIGVDSLRNVSGAQTGALDPTNGMFWTWNSGYIMAKLEGISPSSPDPGQRFQYHIGGYAGAEATQRWVSLGFPGSKAYTLAANTPLEVTITVDIDKWFRSAHELPIASIPLMMTPGIQSAMYADNYATMFSVTNVGQP